MTWRFGRPADEAPHIAPSATKEKLSARAHLRRMMPFLDWLPMVNRTTFRADVFAGLTNAAIVLPQGKRRVTRQELDMQSRELLGEMVQDSWCFVVDAIDHTCRIHTCKASSW